MNLLKIILTENPDVNGYQAKFENLLLDIGLIKGMFAINEKGNRYCNETVNILWGAFKRKYYLS